MANASIVVISAGVSQPSSTRLLADRLARAVSDELAGRGREADVRVIEVRELAHEVVNMTLTGYAAAPLAQVQAAIAAADGVIAVTPVFTAGPAGLFKSFVDVLDTSALRGTPTLLAATGGTARHSLVLEYGVRPMFTYLHADVVATSVFAATDDWADAGDTGDAGGVVDTDPLADRIRRAAAELADRVVAKAPSHRAGPYDDVPSFEDLLGG
ncbi:MAG TPA: CE1759 family FMN reductase [Cellulomonas sp.]